MQPTGGGGKPGQPGLAIAALATGIGGLLTSWCCIGLPLAIAAIVTGILGRKQAAERGVSPTMATVGLVLGVLTLLLAILFTILIGFSTDFDTDFDSSDFD